MAKEQPGMTRDPDLGPLRWIQFMNNEAPGVDVSFNFEGVHFGPLVDGGRHQLPGRVIQHLNGLSTPRMEYRSDPATGQMRSVRVGSVHRFSCHPVDGPGESPEAPMTLKVSMD